MNDDESIIYKDYCESCGGDGACWYNFGEVMLCEKCAKELGFLIVEIST